jgi:hypothetical protein
MRLAAGTSLEASLAFNGEALRVDATVATMIEDVRAAIDTWPRHAADAGVSRASALDIGGARFFA